MGFVRGNYEFGTCRSPIVDCDVAIACQSNQPYDSKTIGQRQPQQPRLQENRVLCRITATHIRMKPAIHTTVTGKQFQKVLSLMLKRESWKMTLISSIGWHIRGRSGHLPNSRRFIRFNFGIRPLRDNARSWSEVECVSTVSYVCPESKGRQIGGLNLLARQFCGWNDHDWY